MKWVWRIGAGVVVICFAVLVFAGFTVRSYEAEVAEVARGNKATVIESMRDASDLHDGDETIESFDHSDTARMNRVTSDGEPSLPPVNRVASRDEISDYFLRHMGGRRDLLSRGAARAIILANGLSTSHHGDDEVHAWVRLTLGDQFVAEGHFERASSYYWSVVEYPELSTFALSRLTWLERDPAESARLIDLNCSGSNPDPFMALRNAIHFAEVTGSVELEEHLRKQMSEHLNPSEGASPSAEDGVD